MTYQMFVNGEWIDSSDEKKIQVLNPATGSSIAEVPSATIEDVDLAAEAAKESFQGGDWSKASPGERANVLLKVAAMLEERTKELAKLETQISGKSIKQTSEYDLPYTVDNIRFLAGASRILEGKAMGEYVREGTSAVRREPIGVVGVITPWNYPLMMVVWRALPALAMGNSVVVKPASYTPLTTIELAKIMENAGVPRGVFNVVTGPGDRVGEELARNKNVDMIAFTGSTEVGRRLSELCASTLKKVSLELGGKAPFIVFPDADLDAATEGAVVGGLVNNGEDCANSTRYYVHESVKDRFVEMLVEKIRKVKVGDPMDPKTDVGPLISSSQRDRVEGFIGRGLEQGGRLVEGGTRPKIDGMENGFFLDPAVIYTENQKSDIVQQEIFGPVFSVLPFSTYEDAISKSNDVSYGLGASVWTKDFNTSVNAVKDLRFGTVWVNEHVPVPSEMPWAGYKESGHGASLSSYSLEEYTYIKHVYFDLTNKVRKSWYYQIYGGQ